VELYPHLEADELVAGVRDDWYRRQWDLSRADSFLPTGS